MSRWFLALVLLALTALPSELMGLQQSPGAYDFLIGTWDGELEYLDYGDDRTLVRLATRLECERSEDAEGLVLKFSYEEPDGSIVTSTERLYEGPQGLYLDGLWQIEEQSHESGAHRLVLTQSGEDSGRPATVRNTISAEGDVLTMTKSVLYEGSEEPLQRNQLRLTRVPVGATTLAERIDALEPGTGAFLGCGTHLVRTGR